MEGLFGETTKHLMETGAGLLVHQQTGQALKSLMARARDAGMDLQVASGFRDFQTQLKIWNSKCDGTRELFDESGNTLIVSRLDPEDTVFAILRWSALPGASRHHWGTDFDVFDAKAVPEGYRLRLVSEEAAPGGPFENFSRWLTRNLEEEHFFRPYARDQGGVSPEWWHISHYPVAEKYLQAMSIDFLAQTIANADMRLKDIVLENLEEIYERFVVNICGPSL